jgi:DNA-binding NarL/FixJ family response regulator
MNDHAAIAWGYCPPTGMQPLATRAQSLIERLATREVAVLGPREREIEALVAKGLSNVQIAEAAHISNRTAESRRS